jgi:very-short-patch-repair endonuclease
MIMKMNRTCKWCKETFVDMEGRVFSNHVRWCDKNQSYDAASYSKKRSKLSLESEAKRHGGNFVDFVVSCHKCDTNFTVSERESKFPSKERYYCSRSCANSRTFSAESNRKRAESNKKATDKLWADPVWASKMSAILSQPNSNFTSKGEVEVRNHFLDKFPEDGWTFGVSLDIGAGRISRDLYSNELKVCFEYDGIWHFKDIHDQLESKAAKDVALNNWCLENNYRMVRMSESYYLKNKTGAIETLEDCIYSSEEQFITLGDEY